MSTQHPDQLAHEDVKQNQGGEVFGPWPALPLRKISAADYAQALDQGL